MSHAGHTFTRRQVLIALGGTAVAAGSAGLYHAYHSYRARTGTSFDGPSSTLGELGASDIYDVCIIGSGPAGTVLGIELARQGLKTVILESGANWTSMFDDQRFGQLDNYVVEGDANYPLQASRLRALGGASNLWTGRCNRLHAIDFEPNAYTPPGAAWPIRLDDVLPYYANAEETLRVHYPDPGEYPATREISRWDELIDPDVRHFGGFQDWLQAEDLAINRSPTSSGIRHGGPVRFAGDYLPTFARLPTARLVTAATVVSLARGADGRIAEAQAKDLDGRSKPVSARVFVIACGAVESARLLLLSSSARDPQGIGNRFDQVGRFFHEHPNLSLSAMLPRGKGKRVETAGRSDQFYVSMKREGRGSILLAYRNNFDKHGTVRLHIGATVEMYPWTTNRVTLNTASNDLFGNPGAHLDLSYSPQDLLTLKRARSLIESLYRRLGAGELTEQPVHWSHHHCGGVQMGSDPQHSVVDANLKIHDVPNLFVLSSGCFVTSGAAHPTLLIVALAHRLANHLRVAYTSGHLTRVAARAGRRAILS